MAAKKKTKKKGTGKKVTKPKVKKAIPGTGGVLMQIAKRCDVSRMCLYNFLNKEENQDIWELITHERETLKDKAENNLFDQIEKGDIDVSKFYLCRAAAERGYGKKEEITHSGHTEHTINGSDFADEWEKIKNEGDGSGTGE